MKMGKMGAQNIGDCAFVLRNLKLDLQRSAMDGELQVARLRELQEKLASNLGESCTPASPLRLMPPSNLLR